MYAKFRDALEKQLQNVVDLLNQAKNDERVALELLHLGEDYSYEPPSMPVVDDKSVIKQDLCTLMYMAAAADRLCLRTTEGIMKRAMQYAMYVYNCVADKPNHGQVSAWH